MRVVRDFSPARSFAWTALQTGVYVVAVTAKEDVTATTGLTASTAFRMTSRITGADPAVTSTTNPLVALYSAPACWSGHLRVQFRTSGAGSESWTSTAAQPCRPGQSLTFIVAGLRADTPYLLRSALTTESGTRTSPARPFTTGSLPSDLTFPAFTVSLGPHPLFDRSDSYIGVMVDDLTLQGVTEPYRMLTARAEYRLRLRADNAEARLTPQAIAAGCVSPERIAYFGRKQAARGELEALLAPRRAASDLIANGIAVRDDGVKRSLADWLRFPELDREALLRLEPALNAFDIALVDEVIEDHRYAPYVARQRAEIVRLRADEAVRIPPDFDYASIPGLSNEMVERLSAARPATLGAAGRVRGVTPAALAAILVQARRKAA